MRSDFILVCSIFLGIASVISFVTPNWIRTMALLMLSILGFSHTLFNKKGSDTNG